jgi:hypothetical protein
MHHVCQARKVEPNARALWQALQHDDTLAAATARLLLFTDPKRLPPAGAAEEAWALYMRVWRPGKPHPQTWAGFYRAALAAVPGIAA